MAPEDYIEFLKSIDLSDPRMVAQAQQIAADDVTLSAIYQRLVSPPKDPDDFVVDVVDPDDY